MTVKEFRQLALALPETTELAHMDHPDFRVRNKIFATLASDGTWGMVKLTPAQQAALVASDPDAFEPFAGAWGNRGCTRVHLKVADALTVEQALEAAWRNTAPARLVAKRDGAS